MNTLEQAILEIFPNATIIKVNPKSVIFRNYVRGSIQTVKISISVIDKSLGRNSMLKYNATKLSLYVNNEYWTCKEASLFNLQFTISKFVNILSD